SSIWFLDINDIGKLEPKDFDKLDLVLFDELVNIKSASAQVDSLINKIEPNYIWFLTAISNEKYNNKFLDEFSFTKQVEFSSFGKSLSDIQGDEPVASIKNIWLELDEMQLFEYSEAMAQAKDELEVLFDSANPLRFQSNIFTIIHKLKQILNFSSFRNISPKANLLIEQLEATHRNKKKAIVFTQYDGNGMKKIQKALEMNDIKFVVARNGMSAEELKQSLYTFYDKRGVTVLLTNLKASRLKINLNKVQYIFNFDQWWNPVSVWQNDDEMGVNDIVHAPVVVYNYHIKNTFEEELQKVIAEKGFNKRYLFDNLKSETLSELITPDDWLSIFGMSDQYKKLLNSERTKILTKLQSIDLNGYKALMKYFFSYLGYRDISVMDIGDE
ncbi:MAG: helicase-related protein, partial [Ignavibacteria bacterium]|nr:helicase-related protein [Ignavibacteria bacterium]